MNQHNVKRAFLFRAILWAAICIIAVQLIFGAISYLMWVPPHRDLGYGVLLRSLDETADNGDIKVYDISGRIRTKELSADVV